MRAIVNEYNFGNGRRASSLQSAFRHSKGNVDKTYFLLIALSSKGAQRTTAALNLHLSPCSPRYLVMSAAPNENPTPNMGEPGYKSARKRVAVCTSSVEPEQ